MKKLALTFMLVFLASTSFAHVPYIEEDECTNDGDFGTGSMYEIGVDSTQSIFEHSIALYGYFESSSDVDYAEFTLTEADFDESMAFEGESLIVTDANGVTGRKLHVGSLVPGCSKYVDVQPSVAIIGPAQANLPLYTGGADIPAEVDSLIGPDDGLIILENPNQGECWWEKFTQKYYYDQEKVDIALTEPGNYILAIWDPEGNRADYVLEIGDVEYFGAAEIARAAYYEMMLLHDGEINNWICRFQMHLDKCSAE